MANPTLGSGRVYLAPYVAGQAARDFRYIGNTPEFNLSIEAEVLEHFNADDGIREKDFEVSLSTNRTGTLTTDNIDPKNVALFFFGEESTVTVVGATVTGEEIDAVKRGLFYQLGATPQNPTGAQGLDIHTAPSTKIIVKDDATPTPATYVEGTDYRIDMKSGMLEIITGGGIVNGTNLVIDYKTASGSFSRVLSGSDAQTVALKFVTKNGAGEDCIYLMPKVAISPNGDYALKGEDWQQIPFNLAILKDDGVEAIYRDGIKFVA